MRLAAVVACAAVAYSFSLRTLLSGWRYETPLADLALVPLLAVLLLVAANRRYPHVAWLRLGPLDVVLATLFLLAAFGLLVVGPVMWSSYFWASRIDLLTLPLFVGAGLILLFGGRSLIPFGFALVFLVLAWPLPYLMLLEQTLAFFTRATAWGVGEIAVPTGLASVDPGADGGVFVLEHGGQPFSVAVASACSGINSLIGFFVVAAFGLYFVRGRFVRRLTWLLLGVVLVWVFNVLRIVGILAAGDAFGQRLAFKLLHPVSGLLALNAAALLLVLLMPRFGLRWRRGEAHIDSPLAMTAAPVERATPRRVVLRLAVLISAAAAFAVADGQLSTAARAFSNDGRPAVSAFTTTPRAAPGWSLRRLEQVYFATPYYGSHSQWIRYRLRPLPGNPKPFTIWLDAIVAPDLGALDAYSLAHCYRFHGFNVDLAQRLDLGDGVVGQAFVYTTDDAHWHAVSWQWPVLKDDGHVQHERIVLLASTPVKADAEPHHSGGFVSTVLTLLNLRRPDNDDNPALTAAMRGVASGIIWSRVEHG
jgi:exosortase/archaeosortase family protein